MDIKDTEKLYRTDNILLADGNYYKYVFKKTEKIVCTVFYLIGHADKGHDEMVAASLKEVAKGALDAVLATLSCRARTAQDQLRAVLGTLVALASHIRVAQAAGVVREEIADILSLEIDTALRMIRQYCRPDTEDMPGTSSFGMDEVVSPLASYRTAYMPPKAVGERRLPARQSGGAARDEASGAFSSQGQDKRQSKGQNTERRKAIKDILALNKRSTIKDISEKMQNCSGKTVQRELIAMVNEGLVLKSGVRRWSRYSLVPGA